jgi:hypothetical protein
MDDPSSYEAYLHGEIGAYGWVERNSPSWSGEHVDADFAGIQATCDTNAFQQSESLVV